MFTGVVWICWRLFFYGLYQAIHHHHGPPFGRTCFEFFQASNMQIKVICWICLVHFFQVSKNLRQQNRGRCLENLLKHIKSPKVSGTRNGEAIPYKAVLGMGFPLHQLYIQLTQVSTSIWYLIFLWSNVFVCFSFFLTSFLYLQNVYKDSVSFNKQCFSQEVHLDQNLPIGRRESCTWIIIKTILCLILDLQGVSLVEKIFRTPSVDATEDDVAANVSITLQVWRGTRY